MDATQLKAQLEACHTESFAWAVSCCGGNRGDAEDLLQTVYLKILEERARFRGESEFKTWLFAVIRKTAIAEVRKQALRRFILFQHRWGDHAGIDTAQPDTSLEGTERQLLFQNTLSQLPARQKEVLHLVFYQDLTISEASEVMGVSIGSARQHYERGKANLRQKLQPEVEARFHGHR